MFYLLKIVNLKQVLWVLPMNGMVAAILNLKREKSRK